MGVIGKTRDRPYKGKPDLTVAEQLEVWRKLLDMPDLMPGQKFCNPFRADSRPGCSLFVSEKGNVILSDWADERYHGLLCINAVAKVAGITYQEAHQQVVHFLEGAEVKIRVREMNERDDLLDRIEAFFDWVPRPWDDRDRKYWQPYGIGLDLLRLEMVHPAAKVWMMRKGGEIFSDTPRIGYVFNVNGRTKLYRPESDMPFYSTLTRNDIGGTTPWDKSSDLYIVGSGKDHLALRAAGLVSRYLPSESTLPSPIVMKPFLRPGTRFVFDNDEGGHVWAAHAAKVYKGTGVMVCCMPPGEDFKDPARLSKRRGLDFMRQTVLNLKPIT